MSSKRHYLRHRADTHFPLSIMAEDSGTSRLSQSSSSQLSLQNDGFQASFVVPEIQINSSRMNMARRRKSLSIQEETAFEMVIDEIVEELTCYSPHEDLEDAHEWIRKIVDYNVLHGKQIRGRGIVSAYRSIVKVPRQPDMKLAYVLGWCCEIFGACFYLPDNILRNSETRRGKKCWHLVENVGKCAINDGYILNGILFFILDKYFSNSPYYSKLVALFHDIFYKTALGQFLDTRGSQKHQPSEFTMQNYYRINKYKVSYFSFYMPIAAAWIMAGKTNKEEMECVESLVIDMGHLYQVQDDYLDVFGDPDQTGKVGTSIHENKLTWFIVKAYELANERQSKTLEENYGQGKDKDENRRMEKSVIQVFNELHLKEKFLEYEQLCYNAILEKIKQLPLNVPHLFFNETADIIFRRCR